MRDGIIAQVQADAEERELAERERVLALLGDVPDGDLEAAIAEFIEQERLAREQIVDELWREAWSAHVREMRGKGYSFEAEHFQGRYHIPSWWMIRCNDGRILSHQAPLDRDAWVNNNREVIDNHLRELGLHN